MLYYTAWYASPKVRFWSRRILDSFSVSPFVSFDLPPLPYRSRPCSANGEWAREEKQCPKRRRKRSEDEKKPGGGRRTRKRCHPFSSDHILDFSHGTVGACISPCLPGGKGLPHIALFTLALCAKLPSPQPYHIT